MQFMFVFIASYTNRNGSNIKWNLRFSNECANGLTQCSVISTFISACNIIKLLAFYQDIIAMIPNTLRATGSSDGTQQGGVITWVYGKEHTKISLVSTSVGKKDDTDESGH